MNALHLRCFVLVIKYLAEIIDGAVIVNYAVNINMMLVNFLNGAWGQVRKCYK